MSELTRCNCCSLEELRRRHGTARVRLELDFAHREWTIVTVDGEPVLWMKQVPDHCVC